MTGHQPHPGISKSGMGEGIRMLKIEDVAKGLGVQHIEVVNPTNIDETKKAFTRALRYRGPSVVVSRAPCILLSISVKRQHGKKIIPYIINQNKCTQCKVCIDKFGCPAFYLEGNQVKIDQTLCTSCGVCQQVCPSNAIEKKGEP
jgi:indolepyruvate ferredoxin oxidoreductase alpha subunit